MGRYKLTQNAAKRLKQIYTYSATTFGESQADAYFESLRQAFVRISTHPQIGRLREDRIDVRCLVHRRHSIFYESHEAGVLILDILGAGQDPVRHLPET